jgi:16S rRNA (uracil1498-N3)-methyltransferase
MKKSLQARLPLIDPPVNLADFLQNLNSQFSILNTQFPTLNSQFSTLSSQKFACHCVGDDRRTLHQLYTPGTDALVLIGPEGDFSPDELSRCLTLGFQPVTLGNNRLRTETAALYALTALNFMNG